MVIEGEPDYSKYSPTPAEMERIKLVPGFSNSDQRRAFTARHAVGGEAAPHCGRSPSAGHRGANAQDQTLYGLVAGNRRGVDVSAGKADAQFNGSADIPDELKAKMKAWHARDYDYRQLSADETKILLRLL